MSGPVDIQLVVTASDARVAAALFDQVWDIHSMVPPEIIVAALHSGGYSALARLNGDVVGASFALASNNGILHSHVTGVAKSHAGSGIGAHLKRHQWAWARSNGYRAIGWTFDPLVRRNAWFNLVKLGANVVSYHENFYGELTDSINSGDHSDRLYVNWKVATTGDSPSGSVVIAESSDVVVPIPDDIETLRQTDRVAALEWRQRQRELLQLLKQPNTYIRGLTRDSAYVISSSNGKT